jgi:hypothetical protein
VNNILRYFLSGMAVSMVGLAQPTIDSAFNFSQAKPGADLTVPGKGFPSSPTEIVLTVQPRGLQISAKSAAPMALVFTLPVLDPGNYTATIAFPADAANPATPAPNVRVTGTLSIPNPPAAPAAEPPKTLATITSVAPGTAYAENDLFSFEIFGGDFPDPSAGSYLLEVSGRVVSPIEVTKEACSIATTPCLKWIGPEHLTVSGIQRADVYQWKTPVRLRINNAWAGPKTLIFSKWQRHWPFLASSAFVVASFLIILLVFRQKSQVGAGAGYNVITRFLLDADTNSYSLSKFQVFSWLTIMVFAYVYVLFCRITIQGVMEWPEFPGPLAGMFGLSLGAMVASTAVTEGKGNKGAGAADPSFADFFSSGGVVAADRFQFFLWTLVGFMGYLSLLWFSDPTTITVVPTVPEGLLYLMGVSAGGYIGGKLARQPGPNITGLKASLDFPANGLHLRILGDNLSPAATMQIGGQEVKTVVRPATVISQAQGRTGFATEMELAVTAPNPAWFTTGTHTLRLINDDGQFAEKDYSIGIATTGPFTKVAAAGGGMAITIPSLALAVGIPAVDLEVRDATGAVFKLATFAPAAAPAPTVVNVAGANPAGPATLQITAPDGSSMKATIP